MPTLAPGAKTFSKRILYMQPPTKAELKKAAKEEEAKNSPAKKKRRTLKFRGRKPFK
tara:strand:- start:797 stop:967 length:171 start_codon:yes stop_codon:yes gene_type:complete